MNPDPAAGSPANTTDASVGIVVSDWHSEITGALLEDALATLERCGVDREDIYVAHVPTAMELPFAARQMSIVQEPSAVVVLGCSTEDEDPMYRPVCESLTQSLTELNLHSDIPYIFGVLLTSTVGAARSLSDGSGNKGAECAENALRMVNMMARLVNS